MGEPTPGQKAAAEFLQDLYDMAMGTGKHAEHTQSQVGRCVYCSCGMRYQGTLPTAAERADAQARARRG